MYFQSCLFTQSTNDISQVKRYICQQLAESIRTDKFFQQSLIPSLSVLTLLNEQWPRLARRIDTIIRDQQSPFEETPGIDELAKKFAQQIIQKHAFVFDADAEHLLLQVGAIWLSFIFFS